MASTLALSLLGRPAAMDGYGHGHGHGQLAPFNASSISLDQRPSLPSIGLTISRAPSRSASPQPGSLTPLSSHRSHSPGIQLPSLSALASIASRATSSPFPESRPPSSVHVPPYSINYATSAPAAAAGQSPIPKCCNCATSTTPLWRRDEVGSVLCNACGLFLKLHGRPRPISLKTDVIKSRNRVKTSGQGPKKKPAPDSTLTPRPPPRSTSPLSRTGTPGLAHHHASNIAPQHIFDGVTLNGHDFHAASLPPFLPPRQPSPSASSINGSHALEPPLSYDGQLRTRVSELEVINDLFRGRVTELEQSEQRARQDEAVARDNERQMREQLDEARAREVELRRRVEELESKLAEYESEGPRQKKMRLSDIVDESAASTPVSTASQS